MAARGLILNMMPIMAGMFSRLADENVRFQRDTLKFRYDYVVVGESIHSVKLPVSLFRSVAADVLR